MAEFVQHLARVELFDGLSNKLTKQAQEHPWNTYKHAGEMIVEVAKSPKEDSENK